VEISNSWRCSRYFQHASSRPSVFEFSLARTYVAHGAVIENMLLQSASLGYTGTVALFPDPNNHDLIARISFLKSTPAPDSLVPYIDKRHTNRKKYKNQPLTDNQRTELSMISGVVLL